MPLLSGPKHILCFSLQKKGNFKISSDKDWVKGFTCLLFPIKYNISEYTAITFTVFSSTHKHGWLQESKPWWGALSWWLSDKESTYQCRKHRLVLVREDFPHATEQLSPCALTIEPVLQSWRAATPESMCRDYGNPHTLKPMLRNKRGHHKEKPVHRN